MISSVFQMVFVKLILQLLALLGISDNPCSHVNAPTREVLISVQYFVTVGHTVVLIASVLLTFVL